MPVIVAALLVAGWTGLLGVTTGVAITKPVQEPQKAAQIEEAPTAPAPEQVAQAVQPDSTDE